MNEKHSLKLNNWPTWILHIIPDLDASCVWQNRDDPVRQAEGADLGPHMWRGCTALVCCAAHVSPAREQTRVWESEGRSSRVTPWPTGPAVLRHGIRQRRGPHVPHSASGKIQGATGSVSMSSSPLVQTRGSPDGELLLGERCRGLPRTCDGAQ